MTKEGCNRVARKLPLSIARFRLPATRDDPILVGGVHTIIVGVRGRDPVVVGSVHAIVVHGRGSSYTVVIGGVHPFVVGVRSVGAITIMSGRAAFTGDPTLPHNKDRDIESAIKIKPNDRVTLIPSFRESGRGSSLESNGSFRNTAADSAKNAPAPRGSNQCTT